MISNQQKQKVKERAVTELKRFIAIALYLWVLFSIFEIHRFFVLRSFNLASLHGYRIGFAAVNALIMGKVILIGEALHVGERFRKKRLIYSVLFKSAMFALLLLCFEIVEEAIVGVTHGKSLVASVPQWGGGGMEGKILAAIMGSVVLIPFFLFMEVREVIGRDKLHSIILQDRSELTQRSSLST